MKRSAVSLNGSFEYLPSRYRPSEENSCSFNFTPDEKMLLDILYNLHNMVEGVN